MRIPAAAVMAAVFLSAAISRSAQAADAGQGKGVEVTLYGAGASSCGTWLADHESLMHSHELSWVLGFLTASENFIGSLGGHVRPTDGNAISAWVDKYCREHPPKNIADASVALVTELTKPE